MAVSEDTEITLGTGKMLAIFFGLVALCAVFFGMGFSLGKSTVRAAAGPQTPAAAAAVIRPSAAKSTAAAGDMSFYKTVAQKTADPAPNEKAAGSDTAAESASAPPDPTAAPAVSGYYVQVAAVSKQEDAQALVEALKKKQYSAFSTAAPGDKLFHVQVGPFPDIKDAEVTRAKLVGDGYNPILKK